MSRSIFLFSIAFLLNQLSIAQPSFSNKYIYSMNICQSLDASLDGGYFFTGRAASQDVVLGKTDSIGNLEWVKKIGGVMNETPMDMVVLNNGNVIVGFNEDSGAFSTTIRTYFMAFDPAGNHLFTKKYFNASGSQVNTINNIIKDGNGFTISMYTGTGSDNSVIKFDSIGNKLLSNALGYNNSYQVTKLSNGDYLFYCNNLLIRCDSLFNPLLVHAIVLSNGNEFITSAIELPSGSIILTSAVGDIPLVYKLSPQLQYEWANYYDCHGMIATSALTDNNALLFWGSDATCYPTLCKPFILQTDTLGNVISGKTVSTSTEILNFSPPAKSCFNNDRFTFIRTNQTASLQAPLSFTISSVDTSFAQLCDVSDTTIAIWSSGLDFEFDDAIPTSINNDSLINATISFQDITFPYGDCTDSTLSINKNVYKNSIEYIFSNPVGNNLLIRFKETQEHGVVTIKDVTGKLQSKSSFNHTNIADVNTTGISNGIYLLTIQTEKTTATQKIIVAR